MDTASFQSQRTQEDFSSVERKPACRSRPFEAKALILSGEIRIRTADGAERRYQPGEFFHLQQDEPHAEWYGPEGVVYLVGRRSTSG